MVEKQRVVSNPLTIIAIFAGLAEIAGTVALATVADDLQHTFVWFVMGFPTVLVALFFLTLNFNPTVLYAPSDFRNEENFLNTLVGTRRLSSELAAIATQLDATKSSIIEHAERFSSVAASEREGLARAVARQLEDVQARLRSSSHAAELVADSAAAALPTSVAFPYSQRQARILDYLRDKRQGASLKTIAQHLELEFGAAERALDRLVRRGLVRGRDTAGERAYLVADAPSRRYDTIEPPN